MDPVSHFRLHGTSFVDWDTQTHAEVLVETVTQTHSLRHSHTLPVCATLSVWTVSRMNLEKLNFFCVQLVLEAAD